jgi:ribonuclease G
VDKELIIDSTPTVVQIAFLERGRLVEIHNQKTNTNFTVGDIFLGQVKRTMPGLNAAFVDTGYKKDSFLHYTDLGPKLRSMLKFTKRGIAGSQETHRLDDFEFEPEIVKTGKIDQVLKKKDVVLVQILKEPISTKGPRLSCEITIPGRYLVLAPFQKGVNVSKKVGNAEERKRLQTLVESIKPENFGLIVRTAAEGKKVADLHEEIMALMSKWKQVQQQLKAASPPKKLLSELDKTSSILRDLLNDSFNRIVVNDEEMYENIRSFMKGIDPKKVDMVKMHKGRKTIFDEYGVTRQIKTSFGKTVTMRSGAYLVIEHTEAMHVIDVNSGQKIPANSGGVDQSSLRVNLESAGEIARQLRLRDIGGLIIIDFIDMKNADHRRELMTQMRHFMKDDRAQHTILPLSKFGLMQITRQRTGPVIKIDTSELCPNCNGTGKVQSSLIVTEEIDRDLEFVMQSHTRIKLSLKVHPFIEAYLKKGFPSKRMNWWLKYGRRIKIEGVYDFSLLDYKFFDGNNDEIRL